MFPAGGTGSCLEREAEVVVVDMGYSTPAPLFGVLFLFM